MTWKETTCPYCGKATSGMLPLWEEFPCKACREKYYHLIGGILIKKEFSTLKEQLDAREKGYV